MPRETDEFMTSRGVKILRRLREKENMSREALLTRYNQVNHANCYICGTTLSTIFGGPISDYFTMDIQGNFYCSGCDTIFKEGDDRIFVKEEEEDE